MIFKKEVINYDHFLYISSGVKIFNVTGNLVSRSTVADLSFSSQTYTVNNRVDITDLTTYYSASSTSYVQVGTISLPSAPICIRSTGIMCNNIMKTGCGVLFNGVAVTASSSKTGTSVSSIPHHGFDADNLWHYTRVLNDFPSIGITVSSCSGNGGGSVSDYPIMDTTSKPWLSRSTTQYIWKSWTGSVSSGLYTVVTWYLHLSSDLKTGYITVAIPSYARFEAYYAYYIRSITAPTSITFENIAF